MTEHQQHQQRENERVARRQREVGIFLVGFGVALLLAYIYMLIVWG